MCGFAGWVRTGGAPAEPVERRALLRRMGEQLARRGPDDERFFDDGTIAFVFRRLAVVDVAGGRQPLHGEHRPIVGAVNGEIYNHGALRAELAGRHTFASRSDCEVVVHLYEEHGTAFLERLNGMFALLLWDGERRRGLLARDRLGIKPLYYAPLNDGLLFASELKALLVHPDAPCDVAWRDLDFSYVGGEEYTAPNFGRVPSFVEGVHVLGGGESLELAAGAPAAPARYWSLLPAIERSCETASRAPEAYVTDYADLFAESVELQLMADVPVGAFLSGGLDSSMIVAAAASRGARLHCFTVSEATTVATGDVGRAARLTRALGVPFHPVRYDRATFADELDFSLARLEEMVWAMDAPRFAPEQFFKYELHRYATTAVPELKVVLLGQGADEFAGGYSRSFSSPRAAWAEYVAESLEPRVRARANEGGEEAAAHAPFHAEMLARLTVLQSHNLWNEDRVSASRGVEARVPFLDHRLVEYLAAIPAALHPQLFWNKRIVRDAARRWLGDEFTQAPKVLFWQADDRSSVHAIMAACARRAYPAFRDAYLGPAARFSTVRLDSLYHRATGEGADSRDAVQRLLACMTVAIFERMCRTLRSAAARAPVATPSPLALDPVWAEEGALRR
ncbi:MAG: hypothetical protein JWM87_2662 [Candidatus Eremiobacteraeota bacterium]|nr:hypothetical protein [Candidatus Eremiobacteraeota bacterium]